MLSGICPRGSSSAPGSGNTGITSGRSLGPWYSAFIGMPASSPARLFGSSGKQDRGQPLASVDGSFVGRAPRLEELHQLLARAVVIPFAVASNDLHQIVDRFLPATLAAERYREIKARLVIQRICRHLRFE